MAAAIVVQDVRESYGGIDLATVVWMERLVTPPRLLFRKTYALSAQLTEPIPAA